jgi:hypothetical protein
MGEMGHRLPWRLSADAAGPPQKAAATAGGRHISNGPQPAASPLLGTPVIGVAFSESSQWDEGGTSEH